MDYELVELALSSLAGYLEDALTTVEDLEIATRGPEENTEAAQELKKELSELLDGVNRHYEIYNRLQTKGE